MSEAKLPQGLRVKLRLMGTTEWAYGKVALCSSNGKSVAITLDGGDFVRTASGGLMGAAVPLVIQDGRAFGLTGDEYEVEAYVTVAEKIQ